MGLLREHLLQVSPGVAEAFSGLMLRRLRKIILPMVVMKIPLHHESRQHRNHFYNPSPETLEEMLAEMRSWVKYIPWFSERKRLKSL